jgi:hypothetical protein
MAYLGVCHRNLIVGVTMGCGTDGRCLFPGVGKNFLHLHNLPMPALKSTRSPIRLLPRALLSVSQRLELEAIQSTSSSIDIKMVGPHLRSPHTCSYISTSIDIKMVDPHLRSPHTCSYISNKCSSGTSLLLPYICYQT